MEHQKNHEIGKKNPSVAKWLLKKNPYPQFLQPRPRAPNKKETTTPKPQKKNPKKKKNKKKRGVERKERQWQITTEREAF